MLTAEVRIYKNNRWKTTEKKFSGWAEFANWLHKLYNHAAWAFRYQSGFWFEAKTRTGVEVIAYPVREE